MPRTTRTDLQQRRFRRWIPPPPAHRRAYGPCSAFFFRKIADPHALGGSGTKKRDPTTSSDAGQRRPEPAKPAKPYETPTAKAREREETPIRPEEKKSHPSTAKTSASMWSLRTMRQKQPTPTRRQADKLYRLSKETGANQTNCPWDYTPLPGDERKALRLHNRAVEMYKRVNAAKTRKRLKQAAKEHTPPQSQLTLKPASQRKPRHLKPLPASTRTPSPDVTWCLRCNRATPCTHHPERP